MKEALTTNQVVIVLVEHPVLGLLLVPYTVGRALDNTLEVIEQAFHASPDALKKMNEAEQKAIDIASHYTEKYLMGVYSREKTVPKFLRKLTEDSNKLKQQIRPFIEKKLLEMLELICNGQLPFYQKPSGSKQLYEHHAYRVHPHNLKTHFSFKVTEEHFSYQLQCYDDDTPVSLMEQKPVVVLTSNPATLLLGMDLYTFSHIEASRLLPFTKKERISADASLTEKYIDNIIIPLARYHDISIQGLKVVREKRPCNAYLYLEDTIYNDTLLRLDFRYGEQSFSPQPSDETKKRRKSSYTISSVIQPLKEKLYICFRKPACNASVTPISSYHRRLPKRTLPNGSATIAKCCSKSLSCPVIHKTNRTIFPKSG